MVKWCKFLWTVATMTILSNSELLIFLKLSIELTPQFKVLVGNGSAMIAERVCKGDTSENTKSCIIFI